MMLHSEALLLENLYLTSRLQHPSASFGLYLRKAWGLPQNINRLGNKRKTGELSNCNVFFFSCRVKVKVKLTSATRSGGMVKGIGE